VPIDWYQVIPLNDGDYLQEFHRSYSVPVFSFSLFFRFWCLPSAFERTQIYRIIGYPLSYRDTTV